MNDAVAAKSIADTGGKTTPLKSAMMKQKESPGKEAIVVIAPLLKSTATKQKKTAEDAVTAISKVDAGNTATLVPPLKSPKKKQNKTSAKEAVFGKMRDRADGNPTGDAGTSSRTEACKSIAKKQKKITVIDAVAADGVADTDDKATPSKLAMMKHKETPVKEANNVDGTSDAVVKADSVKATTHLAPYKSANKKQKKTPAKEAVSTKQSGGAIVTASLSKSTTKKQKKKAAEDAVIAKRKGYASTKVTPYTPH